jgi:hypothetical protein
MRPTKAFGAAVFSLLLFGCALGGPAPPLPVPGTDLAVTPSPRTQSSTSSPTAAFLPPAVIIEEYRTKLQAEIRSWKNAACVNGTPSSVCAEVTLGVQRLCEAAVMELEAARPWPAEQAELAGKTISRLNAVALFAEDGSTPSMLDSELTDLDLALQSWSGLTG